MCCVAFERINGQSSLISLLSLPPHFLLDVFCLLSSFRDNYIFPNCFARRNDAHFCSDLFFIMFLSQSLFHPVYLHISSLPLLAYSLTWSMTNPLFLCAVFSGRETEAWLLSLYMLCCFDGCMIWGIPCPLLQFHISNAIFGHQFVKNQNPDNHVNLEKRKHRDEWTCTNKTLSLIKKKNWRQTWLHKAEINAPESIIEISFCCSV